jgi:hypothetical protein
VFGLLVGAVAFFVIGSLAAQNPLRTRVTEVIPRGAYAEIRMEVRNESWHVVWLPVRGRVHENGTPRQSLFAFSSWDLKGAGPLLLRPGETYAASGVIKASSTGTADYVYHYQWQPYWQHKLRESSWKLGRVFGKGPPGMPLNSGRVGVAEIEIPQTP